jgi:hypothetical protein
LAHQFQSFIQTALRGLFLGGADFEFLVKDNQAARDERNLPLFICYCRSRLYDLAFNPGRHNFERFGLKNGIHPHT